MRDISLDLVRVTEAAAIAAAKWVGSGEKEQADKAATDAMRSRLNRMKFAARVVIGEGKKDESYGLFSGERVGVVNPMFQDQIYYDLAVDPVEGTRPTVTAGPEAISTLAVAKYNCMYETDHFYMLKLAYGKQIKEKLTLSLTDPLERTIELASTASGKKKENLVVCILDRPRHQKIISTLRKIGVRIKLIQDCDVSGAVSACLPNSGIDLLYGVGGAPEAVISAAAIKCLGGDIQATVVDVDGPDWELNDYDLLNANTLVKGECIFVATGITNGSILSGVRYRENQPITNSVFMRSESGTVRWIEARHGN